MVCYLQKTSRKHKFTLSAQLPAKKRFSHKTENWTILIKDQELATTQCTWTKTCFDNCELYSYKCLLNSSSLMLESYWLIFIGSRLQILCFNTGRVINQCQSMHCVMHWLGRIRKTDKSKVQHSLSFTLESIIALLHYYRPGLTSSSSSSSSIVLIKDLSITTFLSTMMGSSWLGVSNLSSSSSFSSWRVTSDDPDPLVETEKKQCY